MSLAGIVTLVVVILFALHGMKKGLVKKLSGVLSVVIAAALVNFLLPGITQAIKNQTPLYDMISTQVEHLMERQALFSAISGEGNGAQAPAVSGGSTIDREQVKQLLSQYGVDPSQVDYLSDSELEGYVAQYAQSYQEVLHQETAGALDALSKVEQTRLIKDLPVPDFLQRMMINYNNSEGYRAVGATDFAQYLVRFIANIILNIAAFLVTMLVTWVIVRGILAGLNLFSRLPVLGLANRIGGLLVGAVQGLFAVWVIFLVISLLSGTQVGLSLQNMINDSFVLQPIYETNAFLKIVTNAIGNMM